MKKIFEKIKNWLSDQQYITGHNANANRLIKDQNKRWYRVKSNTLIKILTELDKKAGLGSYDIVPFLKKIDLMSDNHMKTEKENSKFTIDRQSNTDFFNELQELGFIKVIDNKLFSYLNGTRYPTFSKDCVLIVKLLPKGLDYLIERRKKQKDNFYQKFTIGLLIIASILSLPQACNQTSEWFKKDDTIYKINIVNKDSVTEKKEQPNITEDAEYNIGSGNSNIKKGTPKPISETTKQ